MIKQYRLLWNTISTSKKMNAIDGGKWWRIGCHLVYTWLLAWQDDGNRLRADPLWLIVNVFPNEGFTEKEMGKILMSLQKVGLIYWYKIDGEGLFLEIIEDEDHQRIRKDRKKPSSYPPPCLTDDGQLTAECLPDVYQMSGYHNHITNSIKTKTTFLDCVTLTEEEHKKLIDKYGKKKAEKAIDSLNNYKMSKGKKYKSDYHAILRWVIDSLEKKDGKWEPL